jgi:hypothetical protein
MAHRSIAIVVRVGRTVLAVVLGYLTLILLTTLVQETLLGGVSYHHSTTAILIVAGLLTPLASVVAGFVTAAIAGRWLFIHNVPMAIAIAVETTVLYTTGRVDGPLWFEALAGGTLIAGAFAGAWLFRRMLR